MGQVTLQAQSLKLDRDLGSEAAKQVFEQIGIYPDENLNDYVDSLGQKLVGQLASPAFPYHFYVVDMKEPNAFALPGGYVFVSRGLLCVANTEDELAGVIGHEIVHSQNRHSVQQMRKSIFPTLLQIPGAVVGTVINEDLGNLINTPINAGSQLLLSNYSRRHEREADQIGIEISAMAGYDPVQLGVILRNLSREMETLTGEEEKFSYFDSHPFTPNRVKAINRHAKQVDRGTPRPICTTKEAFLARLDGIYFWDDPRQGIFRDSLFLHPEIGLHITFPAGWQTVNTPVAVGAVEEDGGRGMIYLGQAEENKDPAILGKQFEARLKKQHNKIPEVSGSLELNGLPAYRVSLADSSGGEKTGIHSLWFRMGGTTYRVIGIAYESEFELLRQTALSIRRISVEERNSIKIPVVKIVRARAGENINTLSERTGNIWKPDLTAIMNNLQQDVVFEQDELIKIAVSGTYRPTEN